MCLEPGTVLEGKYLIGRTLGRGGFGITYIGCHLQLAKRAAIKEYFPEKVAGRSSQSSEVRPRTDGESQRVFQVGLRQFNEEARQIVRFSHPNIVRATDFFEVNGTAYLVMDYVDGMSLEEYLGKGGRIDEGLALQIMIPVLDGLREVHKAGILHRDIKPNNIYLTERGNVILLDFGSARQVLGEETRSLSVMLTPGYAPQEQYSRYGHQGPWTDVYACGAVLYRCLTGHPPPDVMDRINPDDPPTFRRPSSFPGVQVSPRVEGAILDALRVDPKQRPQSIEEFQTELERSRISPESPGIAKTSWDVGQVQQSPAQEETQAIGGRRKGSRSRASYGLVAWILVGALSVGGGIAGWRVFFRDSAYEPEPSSHIEEISPPAPGPSETATPTATQTSADTPLPTATHTATQTPSHTPLPTSTPTPTRPSAGAEQVFSLPNGEPLVMVYVPDGTFWMGTDRSELDSLYEWSKESWSDFERTFLERETPRHEVSLNGFWLGKCEVTNTQFQAFSPGHDSGNREGVSLNGGSHPVVNVSWQDAQDYISWLNRAVGAGFRLPTEAEWEYACRAGSDGKFFWGDRDEEMAQYVNCADKTAKSRFPGFPWTVPWDDGFVVTAPVGSLKPNRIGLYDMLGNVWEWCQDGFEESYLNAPPDGSAAENVATARTVRGGAWICDMSNVRCGYRAWDAPDTRSDTLGFRLCKFP